MLLIIVCVCEYNNIFISYYYIKRQRFFICYQKSQKLLNQSVWIFLLDSLSHPEWHTLYKLQLFLINYNELLQKTIPSYDMATSLDRPIGGDGFCVPTTKLAPRGYLYTWDVLQNQTFWILNFFIIWWFLNIPEVILGYIRVI